MLSANSDSFTISFPILMPFIHFAYLIAVARTFNTMLINSGASGYPALFLILEEKLSAFHH